MHLVYLDQNVWVALSKGVQSGDAATQVIVDRLIGLRDADVISVPLSTAHYLETWHRRDAASRHALAAVMRDVTAYATLAPIHDVERASVRSEIRRRFGFSPQPLDAVLGYGVNHAFGVPTGRFRFVSSIATDQQPEGPPIGVPPDFLALAEAGGEAWEWFNLSGPEELLVMDGIDAAPQHRRGTSDARFELEVRDLLQHEDEYRRRLGDLIVTQELIRTLDYVNDACEELNLNPRLLFNPRDMKATARSFVQAVPVTDVIHRLRVHRHRNHSFPIEQHDYTDMAVLGLAIPHCAVVVTERRWAHAARQEGLDHKYGVSLCASLKELDLALDQLGNE